MNQDQVLSLVRALMLVAGTVCISQGMGNAHDWAALTTAAMTIAGAVLAIWPIVWSMIRHTKAGEVAAVAAMPETAVSDNGAVILVKDSKLAKAAKAAATPLTAGDLM